MTWAAARNDDNVVRLPQGFSSEKRGHGQTHSEHTPLPEMQIGSPTTFPSFTPADEFRTSAELVAHLHNCLASSSAML